MLLLRKRVLLFWIVCYIPLNESRRVQRIENGIVSTQSLVELGQSIAFAPLTQNNAPAPSRTRPYRSRYRNPQMSEGLFALGEEEGHHVDRFDRTTISQRGNGVNASFLKSNLAQGVQEPCVDVGFWAVPDSYFDEVLEQSDPSKQPENLQGASLLLRDIMKIPLLLAMLSVGKLISRSSSPMRSRAPAMKDDSDDTASDNDKARFLSMLTSGVCMLASLAGIIAFDVVLRRVFSACAITFPSSLAGMMMLFCGLCTTQLISPKIANGFASLAAPGCGFISRWLAIFFVPNMIVLPVVLKMSISEAVRVLTLIVMGLMLSLPVSALTATRFLAAESTDASSSDASVASAPAPMSTPEKPWKALLAWTGITGAAAMISQWGLGGGSVTIALIFSHFLTCTVCGFIGGQKIVPKSLQKVLHPLITCTIFTQLAIALFAKATSQPVYGVLRGYLAPGGSVLSAPGNLLLFMLGPATLSFAFQMFSQRRLMAQSAAAVSAVTLVSSMFGLLGTAFAGRVLNLSASVRLAALSRQVTAPLAIAIAGMLKTDPAIAVTITLMTGLLAANFGRAILDTIGVRSPVARGLAMGASGHGIGTAAMAEEPDAFPFAAIALALIATGSTVLVSIPSFKRLLFAVAGVPPL